MVLQEAPRRHDFTNVDQVSLLNSSIDSALKRQSDSFMQYIDSRFSQLPKPTVQPVDDFVFSREGNKIQFKFNTERSNKLSDILECIQSKDFEAAELIIKSELNEITQRNKIIKIADRHGWDVVKEYSIPPLADDNEDAVKLRAAINRATRRRAKPYERSNLRLQLGVDLFVANQTLHQQKATSQHFQQERVSSATSQDISPGSVHINSDSTHQGKHQAPQFLFNQTTPPPLPTVSKPREDEVEYKLLHSFEYSEKYELKSGSKSVKGRLKLHSKFWENTIRANSFILDVIKEGYKIPFMAQPTPVLLKNNASAIKHRAFVTTAINELLESGCVVEQSKRHFCVNPPSVSVNKNGKERLILDLRHVNQFVEKRKIKFEGSKEALNYAKKGKFMVKFDLRSGYHHVDINNKFQKYLGFSWEENGQVKYFVFSVLPFGLTSAPFLFTKLMREIVRYWRTLTFPVIIYLDDGWCCHDKHSC